MSPTSLRNHRSQRRPTTSVRPVPAHRRALALLRTSSKRSRYILTFLSLFILYRLFFRSPPSSTLAPRAASPSSSSSEVQAGGGAYSIRLAPAQIRPPSATIEFKSGRAQAVFPNNAQLAVGEDAGFEAVWMGSVARVELPVGGRLSYVSAKGVRGLIERGRGDDCRDGHCARLEGGTVRLELDLLRGLGEFKRAVLSEELKLVLPCIKPFPHNTVTLVTQFTLSRMARFERTLREWDGPISVTIYLTDPEDILKFDAYLRTSPEHLARFNSKRVALTVVKPDYGVSDDAILRRLQYPINRLRNLALNVAPTEYVVVTDADFVPSPGMQALLSTRGVPLIQERHARRSSSLSPTLQRTAVAVSAFALATGYSGAYPSTPFQLEKLVFGVSPPLATLTDANAGHGPTMPSLLLQSGPTSARLGRKDVPNDWSFPVAFEPQWEPYYLLQRASHPLYDERFTDQGGDKQSHALLLNALGYEFHVLRDVWFMHPPKRLMAKEAPREGEGEIDEDWPGARLYKAQQAAQGAAVGGEAEGREKDHDPAHFSHAQRDKKRFRYFQDWLPEMERQWGGMVRWSRGADARVVCGARSFGRARAGVVFGL